MSVRYAAALLSLGERVDRFERALLDLPEAAPVDLDALEHHGWAGSKEEFLAIAASMADLSVLERVGTVWRLNKDRLQASGPYRAGIRDGLLAAVSYQAATSVQLVAALPPEASRPLEHHVWREAGDLRASLMDLIAAAKKRVVLASPYWDAETADELFTLLSRRTALGIAVDLLGRTVGHTDEAGRVLSDLAQRLGPAHCTARGWARRAASAPFGLQTFHFKAAVSDNGAAAYLGSANFTTGGLRSRMELGVIARGDVARAISRVLDAALNEAR